jgi:exodeoxyribonuclease V alpha subunit
MDRDRAIWRTQVLVATNDQYPLSRVPVNKHLQAILNPDGKGVEGIPFRVGDKVICTRNTYEQTYRPKRHDLSESALENFDSWEPDGEQASVYVANGDQGAVLAVGPKGVIASIGRGIVHIPRYGTRSDSGEGVSPSDVSMGDYQLGYAITVHKSQGSQWPVVIAMADPNGGGVADRNWWYTAISRAERACIVLGHWSAFAKQSRAVRTDRRKTFLAELIRGGTP